MLKKAYYIRRIIAFLIDWIIIWGVSVALFLSGPRFDVQYLLYPSIKMFSAWGVIAGIASLIILPFIKDLVFGKRSLGKLIMRLKIVNSDQEKPVSAGQLMARNLTFYIAYVELIMLLVNKGKTLGDMVSGSRVE